MKHPFFRGCVLALPALLLVRGATAQSDKSLITLDGAIAYAREHSPLLSAARQTVLGRRAAIAAARAERLPRVAVDAGLRGNNLATETALGFPLTPLSDLTQQPFSHAHLNGIAEATVPLYSGGRLGAERHLAEAESRVAEANAEDVQRNLEYEVTTTYARLVQVERDLIAAHESAAALTESQRIAADMLKVGKIARVDLLKVDTRLADVQAQVISLTDEREILAGQLNALLGRAVETPVSVQQDMPSPGLPPITEQVAAQAATGSTQYALAGAQLGATERSLELARAQLRPELSFSAMAFGQSFDPFSMYRGGVVAGFSFRYPLFDRPLQEKVKEAKSAELESRARTEQARLDAIQRARTAALQVHDAEARAAATESSIAEAREALRIEQEKQRYGRETMEHLLDAQAALLTLEANYYRALADETIATAALKRETGK